MLALFAPCPMDTNLCLGDPMPGRTEPLTGRTAEPLHSQISAAKAGQRLSNASSSSMRVLYVWTGQPRKSDSRISFSWKLPGIFLADQSFFDVGVSGRWEISSNSHGTFSVFKKRRKSFYQHFDYQFMQNYATSFYFNPSQLLKIFLKEHLKYLYCLLSLEQSGKYL